MMKWWLVLAALGLGACGDDPPPVVDRRDADIAAASQRAVNDTDGAMRDAATSSAAVKAGTN